MSVLSIDPGDTSGLCEWSNSGMLMKKVKLTHEELVQTLADFAALKDYGRIHTVVVEDYTQRVQQQNAKGRKMKAPRGIGAVELFCAISGADLCKQGPDILTITAMHHGIPVVGHFSDDVSAQLHGLRWFETQGLAPNQT